MKDKKMIVLIAVIVLLVLGLSYAKTKAPKPVDWSRTFYNTKTDPYGTYITYKLLNNIFDGDIKSTRMPIYNNLKDQNKEVVINYEGTDYEDDYYDGIRNRGRVVDTVDIDGESHYAIDIELPDTTSYIFINTKFKLDRLDMDRLLEFAILGNNVFISAENFDPKLLDTLKIETRTEYMTSADTLYTLNDYPKKGYQFGNVYGRVRLSADSCPYQVRVLAQGSNKDTVFIDIKYGKGHIYMHTLPSAFANVNMLQTDKYDFGFRCLSYLPRNSKIIWDEYQKQGLSGDNDSSFRVMLAHPPLKTALYIILLGFLLYMIFRAKRIQRIIPVIKPPVNSSLEFLGTVSNLYYRKKDYMTIAEKRHAYFLDFIRKHYYMPTENIDGDFVNVLSAKSGMEKQKLNELFSLYKDIIVLPYIANDIFLKYNSLLEEFYKSVKNK